MIKYFSVWKAIIISDRMAVIFIVCGLILNVVAFILLRLTIPPTTPNAILHYNVFFGIDVFGFEIEKQYIQVFFAPIGGAIIWVCNTIVGSMLYGQVLQDLSFRSPYDSSHRRKKKLHDYYLDFFDANRLASYLLWGSAAVVQLIMLVYIGSVILVNK